MPDALTEARAMDLPAAAVARVARQAQIGMDDAEVVVARLVLDLREAGWIVAPPAVAAPSRLPLKAEPFNHDLPSIDPRVSYALIALAKAEIDLADGAILAADTRRKLKRITDGVFE